MRSPRLEFGERFLCPLPLFAAGGSPVKPLANGGIRERVCWYGEYLFSYFASICAGEKAGFERSFLSFTDACRHSYPDASPQKKRIP